MRGHSEQPPGGPPDFGDDFFRGMVTAANDAVLTANADGTIVYANEAVEDLLGYAPAELRGEQFVDFVPERLRDRYDGWFDRYTDGEGGTPLDDETYEMTWRAADGTDIRLSVSGFVHENDGQPLFTGFVREATDPDESAERLRDEEALIEEIFETSPIALAVRDADGELLRANERAIELAGVGSDELLYDAKNGEDAKDAEDTTAAEDADDAKNADDAEADDADTDTGEWAVYDTDGQRLSQDEYPVSRVFETGEPVYNEEVVVEQPSGRRVHLSVSATPVRDDGEVKRVVSTAEDVTELKETQYELEQRRVELETELSEVFTRIADAFIALDTDWNLTYLNDEAEELLLRSEEDLVGENLWEAFSEAEGTKFQSEYERAMETQEPVSFVEYYPPLSTWFEVRAYPSETGLSVYFRDVTERKAREQQLERYETIVETVDDGIYAIDTDGTFSMVNSAFTKITGYDREKLLDEGPSMFYDDEISETVEERQREILSGERDSATVEHDLETSDGETIRVEVTFVAHPTEDGHERIGVLRDVTERKERERELRDRVKQQRAVAEFSQAALEDRSLDGLFDEAVELVAETLDHDYCKVLELHPENDELLLRNGVGWDEGIVGSATVADDRGSQAGYTLISEEPVVVEDLETEERFSGSELLTSHDVQSGISTIIGSADDPWGILGTHDTERHSYADHDVQFVQSIAHILTTAIHRREREHELEASEERYRTLVENFPNGSVLLLDEELRYVIAGGQIFDEMEVSPEDLEGKTIHEALPEEVYEVLEPNYRAALDGEPSTFEVVHEGKTFHAQAVPVADADGEVTAAMVVTQDVTERKAREQQLERYETIVETVEDGVYALDSDEQFVMVNDAFCEMTGYDRAELLGEHASVVHSEDVSEQAADMSDEVADEMGSAMLEVDLRTKGGDTVPVESRFGPYRYEDDEFARTGVVRDITERKRFEQTLTALHESSRELLQLETADAVAESVLQTTTDVLGIRGAGIYLYDDEKSELAPAAVSEYVADIFGDLPTFGPGDEAITWQAFAEGETITYDDVLDTDLTYREDTPLRSGIWIPLGDHGVLAVVSDEPGAFGPDDEKLADLLAATTEAALDRVERERERRKHERELEQQNERLDAFASMLAHELRNPLEIAQIYLDMGVETAVDEADDASAFEEVERALDRIEEMIETLLVVTRRGGEVDTTETVALDERAREWWSSLDPEGTLDVRADRRIRADCSRLRQLFENLYRNSEEHAGPGVTVRVGDLPDEAGFYVEDDGPGIPEEERGQVFDPGYSTSSVGIGFGLAVVRQLVDAHDWHCEIAESDEGGARFEFTDVDVVGEKADEISEE